VLRRVPSAPAGAAVLVVPSAPEGAPARRHWPVTAQALAVLLATTSVRVVVGVPAHAWEPDALARFAASATGLAGERLVVRVLGPDGAAFAQTLADRWSGHVVVGDDDALL
jgi:hypothetical protein